MLTANLVFLVLPSALVSSDWGSTAGSSAPCEFAVATSAAEAAAAEPASSERREKGMASTPKYLREMASPNRNRSRAPSPLLSIEASPRRWVAGRRARGGGARGRVI